MKQLTVILTGAGGQLGQELQRCVPDGVRLHALDSRSLDVTDKKAVHEAFERIAPDVAINAAAYTAVDKAEAENERAYAVNAEAPRLIAEACRGSACRIVHISTDFVFDGRKSSPYLPDDAVNPLSVYGASKLLGEQHLLDLAPESALIIRTSWLYSSLGNNFVKTMLRLMTEREQLGVIADQVGTPTHAKGLAEAVWAFIERGTASGIHHWSDAGVASWYDFAVAIMEEGIAAGLLQKPLAIRPIQTTDYPTPAERPKYSVLDKTATWAALASEPVHWRVALRAMLGEIAS
jgi:dTDP-4-dehydrorhamnose reductase